MRTAVVQYKKVINLGNYSNEQIGVEIHLDAGDNAQEALDKAKAWVELNCSRTKEDLERAREILKNPMDFTGREVDRAEKVVKKFEEVFSMFSGPSLAAPTVTRETA